MKNEAIETGGPINGNRTSVRDHGDGVVSHTPEVVKGGLTIRDHFAGLAMQGTLAGQTNLEDEKLAEISYTLADAMIEARKEQS